MSKTIPENYVELITYHHAAEVAFEICRAMADPEHAMHEAFRNAQPAQWAKWREFFRTVCNNATE